MWSDLEKKIDDWEKRFLEIRNKKAQDYHKADVDYIKRELVLLKEEKIRVHTRLRKIEELIAKAHVLEDDLNEDLCYELSGGHSLASVGESLKKKFGKQLKEGNEKGREKMRDFLEQHYNINRKKSRELFALLEELNLIHFWIELPENIKNAPLLWDKEDAVIELGGSWEIKA